MWRDGHDIFTTLVNTGIPQAPTATGTYPVYARYLVTTMTGKNPNGTPYSDPGIPWVSYFNGGDALHGFIRASYGFPQSLGCVEMTYADAETMYPLDTSRHACHRASLAERLVRRAVFFFFEGALAGSDPDSPGRLPLLARVATRSDWSQSGGHSVDSVMGSIATALRRTGRFLEGSPV